MLFDILCSALFIAEMVAMHFFYSSEHGKKAVYVAWYAWIIDLLAIMSGISIMTLAVFSKHHPALFAVQVPNLLFLVLFMLGSWQTSIHSIKWITRTRCI